MRRLQSMNPCQQPNLMATFCVSVQIEAPCTPSMRHSAAEPRIRRRYLFCAVPPASQASSAHILGPADTDAANSSLIFNSTAQLRRNLPAKPANLAALTEMFSKNGLYSALTPV